MSKPLRAIPLSCCLLIVSMLGCGTKDEPGIAAAPESTAAILRSEFIYGTASFPSAHASTIAQASTGLVAAWFGGKDEGEPDVAIWLSRHDGNAWSPPVEVANGKTPEKQYPCWNPVLFQAPAGPLVLFYKVGPSPSKWWGMRMTSADGGRTWSTPTRIPDGFLGPIRCKPILLPDGTLLAGSSTEHAGWHIHMELSRDLGITWTKSSPAPGGVDVGIIQPTILRWGDGRLQILCRYTRGNIVESWSADEGKTWSAPKTIDLPNPNAGIDAVMLNDGRALLVYNHTPKGRTPLSLAVSKDGKTWNRVLDLETALGEFSYPAMIQTADGKVHITYTWKRQRIRHVVVDPAKLAE